MRLLNLQTPTRPTRRGFTLVEMLVTVALVMLIMVIIVAIFRQAATATSVQKVGMELEQSLRRFDATIRQDLQGATAHFTPPLNPNDQLGYFEYGENSGADAQGEDSDDYLAFTAKAAEGQAFRGHVVVSSPTGGFIRVPITSQFAEIIYFVRNGNLYRRVLLIVPDRKNSLTVGPNRGGGYFVVAINGGFQVLNSAPPAGVQPLAVSWLSMNTISARPSAAALIPGVLSTNYVPIPNTLGDLTNRENRFARPRFSNDFLGGPNNTPDGSPDDVNGDGIPDYYPTLYPTTTLINELPPAPRVANVERMPFPYLFPGDYTEAGAMRGPASIHILDPANPTNLPNHNPIPLTVARDNLAVPALPLNNLADKQTWWGFPTSQETLSPYWTDPIKRINDPGNAPYFANTTPQPLAVDEFNIQAPGLSWLRPTLLPPMTTATIPNTSTAFRRVEQPFNDTAGSVSFAQTPPATNPPPPADAIWLNGGQSDDLILTGVRGFDVKAYDPYAKQYVDLGYIGMANTTAVTNVLGTAVPTLDTFGHEGRMPPILWNGNAGDYRLDSQWPLTNFFVGDTSTSTIRMLRVWDSWSTDYAYPPDTSFNSPISGPLLGQRPVYPGYSAPYPAPLTGIQIHIRIVDPRNERIKVLTIKQDFTDKL